LLVLPQSNRASHKKQPAGDLEPTIWSSGCNSFMTVLTKNFCSSGLSPICLCRHYELSIDFTGYAGWDFDVGANNFKPDMPQPDEGQVYDWIMVANGSLSTVISGLSPKLRRIPKSGAKLRDAITSPARSIQR
jgi:hypothetical protein